GWIGRRYAFREISIWPRPVQAPHPPVYMSAASAESAVFAARHRLGGAVSFTPPHVAARQFRGYTDEAARAGWTPRADDLLYRGWCYVAETDAEAERDVASSFMGGGVKLAPRQSVMAELVARGASMPGAAPRNQSSGGERGTHPGAGPR